VRGFDQLVGLPGSFDAAICVGNSLALAPDTAIAQRAVQQMLAAVRAGGAVVVHALNLWALPDGPCVWQKCRRATLPQGEVLIVKGVHRCGTRGFVELLVASSAGEPQLQTDSVPFLGLEASDLEHWARDAGACRVAVYDGYQEQPYQRELSADLLVLAEK
jgi:SAM-dependent methyltransferase